MERQPAVDKLIEVIERFASGDLNARTNLPHDETDFGRLASSLDKMLDTIASRQVDDMKLLHWQVKTHGATTCR